jgi:hypothetical protein
LICIQIIAIGKSAEVVVKRDKTNQVPVERVDTVGDVVCLFVCLFYDKIYDIMKDDTVVVVNDNDDEM